MELLNDDVQIKIFSFLQPDDIFTCYDCFLKKLSSHIGFVVNCTSIISDDLVAWFQEKQIKFKLLQIYKILFNGTRIWSQNGQFHRDGNLPAIIHFNGTQWWYQNGKLYRDFDQPVTIYIDGTQCWSQNDQLHRDNDQPALITKHGDQYWYQNGHLHRDDDQPAIIFTNGLKCWYQYGKLCKSQI